MSGPNRVEWDINFRAWVDMWVWVRVSVRVENGEFGEPWTRSYIS